MNQDLSLGILVYRSSYTKPKELPAFMYANLEAMHHLAVFWRKESGERKRNNLVQCFWRQECVCLIVYQLLPSSQCLLLTYGQFTLPLELFPRRKFRDVRAYCIVLKFWFNVPYFLTQECMKHNLVKHSNHLHRPTYELDCCLDLVLI